MSEFDPKKQLQLAKSVESALLMIAALTESGCKQGIIYADAHRIARKIHDSFQTGPETYIGQDE